MFYGYIGKEPPALPPVEDDAAATFATMRADMQSMLDDPEIDGTEFDGFFGPTTFEAAVDRFLNFDLLVHGWDLARATGQDEQMDPAGVDRLTETVQSFGDAARAPSVFGPEVEAPPGADAQAKVLAFMGRRA